MTIFKYQYYTLNVIENSDLGNQYLLFLIYLVSILTSFNDIVYIQG